MKPHTPTPWEYEQIGNFIKIISRPMGGHEIILTSDITEQDKIDHLFIVRAVNNIERIEKQRDQLLEAARIAVEDIKINFPKTYISFRMYKKLEQAIQSVEGGRGNAYHANKRS